jgi:hypothetical protein
MDSIHRSSETPTGIGRFKFPGTPKLTLTSCAEKGDSRVFARHSRAKLVVTQATHQKALRKVNENVADPGRVLRQTGNQISGGERAWEQFSSKERHVVGAPLRLSVRPPRQDPRRKLNGATSALPRGNRLEIPGKKRGPATKNRKTASNFLAIPQAMGRAGSMDLGCRSGAKTPKV